jgi:hypothetical protein
LRGKFDEIGLVKKKIEASQRVNDDKKGKNRESEDIISRW